MVDIPIIDLRAVHGNDYYFKLSVRNFHNTPNDTPPFPVAFVMLFSCYREANEMKGAFLYYRNISKRDASIKKCTLQYELEFK